jgi:hypothetical protein
VNIITAIKDENLFKNFLADKDNSIESWNNWFTALRVLYGLQKPLNQNKQQLLKECTGRDMSKLPKEGFDTALFLIGRRSGKSRIAAIIAAYEAALSGKEKLLSKGELGMVAIIAPTKKQGRIVKNYLRAIFVETPLLQNEIENETSEGFLLSNGVLIEILVGDWRNIRGYTLLACVVDEVCFFGLTEESKVKNDSELITAIKPSLATTNGRLICISSPYAKKGWAYNQHKRNFGNDLGKTLVWNCASRVMNPTLPQSVVDEALQEDLAAGNSEYLGLFRDDVAIWLPREVIESVVVKGRKELLPNPNIIYFGFVDVSGGRSDDASLCIGHKKAEKRQVIIDFIRRYRSPHSPYQIIGSMCEELRRFFIRKITGDNYSAEFVKQAFEQNGMKYEKSELPKSGLYLELLPRICSKEIELLDDEVSINQLASLERRTRSGGKDTVDHGQGGKDDVANSIAGLSFIVISRKRIQIGAF